MTIGEKIESRKQDVVDTIVKGNCEDIFGKSSNRVTKLKIRMYIEAEQ